MKIAKNIILPEWEGIEDFEQTSDILKQLMEALKNHNIQNYDDAVANYKRVTTGRIQSIDGETYFDLDTGVIRGQIVFRAGTSGFENVEDASPDDWDNAFKLADAVKGNPEFTLIAGGKIVTNSILVGSLNSDVITRMFSDGDAKTNIEAWMKSGATTYIDGEKIYAGSITLTGLGATIIEGGYIKTSLLNVDYSIIVGTKPPANADYFGGSAGALAYLSNVETAQLGSTIISGGYLRTDLIKVKKVYVGGGTNEDIYFEDSGVRMYDYGGRAIFLYKSGYKNLQFKLSSSTVAQIGSDGIFVLAGNGQTHIAASGTSWIHHSTGQLQLPNLGSNPSGVAGGICMVNNQLKYWNGSSWENA